MNALNSVHFLRSHGTVKSWLAFWILDVLSLPLVFLLGLPRGRARGVLAKGRGILKGLGGAKVSPADVEHYFSKEEKKR